MTRHESFKRRVRARMAATGERYTAARKVLLDQAARSSGGDRIWVSPPEMSDDAIRARTGRGHNQWADIIEAWADETGNDRSDHAAIARHLERSFDELDGWWAQAVTVSYERITGLRLPYQRADGTFTAGKSKTVNADPELLRKLLLSDRHRADLFPGHSTDLRSKPTSKTLRIAVGPDDAVAVFTVDPVDGPAAGGRTKVAVQHERLPTYDSVLEWKHYWEEWLDAVDESSD